MRSDLDVSLQMRMLQLLGRPETMVLAAATGDYDTLKRFLSEKPEMVSSSFCPLRPEAVYGAVSIHLSYCQCDTC